MYGLLLHFQTPVRVGRRTVQHHFQLTPSIRSVMVQIKLRTHPAKVVRAANNTNVPIVVGKAWRNVSPVEARSQRLSNSSKHCRSCRHDRLMKRQDQKLPELLEQSIELARQQKLPFSKPGLVK